MSTKSHWDKIYKEKSPNEVSWTQEVPVTSIKFFEKFKIDKSSPIIDIGGGESRFVDYLIKNEYKNISVLDISINAINRVKDRLGKDSDIVNWIVSDINDFNPKTQYSFWHDRAVFHFLTDQNQIKKYVDLVSRNISNNGYLIIGTFSEQGPLKCSGLEVSRYSESLIKTTFIESFSLLNSFKIDHSTPFNTTQNFLFSVLKKINV